MHTTAHWHKHRFGKESIDLLPPTEVNLNECEFFYSVFNDARCEIIQMTYQASSAELHFWKDNDNTGWFDLMLYMTSLAQTMPTPTVITFPPLPPAPAQQADGDRKRNSEAAD